MHRKFFAIWLAVLLAVHGAALARKKVPEIPEAERVRIAIEVVDATNFSELYTAEILRDVLINQLDAKKIVRVVNANGGGLADLKSLGDKKGASDVGDLVIFAPEKNIDARADYHGGLGARYVLHCEVIGLGIVKAEPDTFDVTPGIGVGLESDSSLGVGIGIFGGAASTLRNFYSTAVSVSLVDLESGGVVLRKNLTGRTIKRSKPSRGYDDASDEAYLKSIRKAGELITKSVDDFALKTWSDGK